MSSDTRSQKLGFFKRHYILTSFLFFIIAAVSWWKYEHPTGTWRYKLTVTIETPDGIKSGSAVREVTYINGPKILPDVAGSTWKVKGEAVVIDLGQGRYLFAPMDVDGSYSIVYDAFPYRPTSARDSIRYYESLVGQKKTLNRYPELVTFKNIKDFDTVTKVDAEKLAGTFGEGVKFKEMTIEMSDEDVTREISKYLGSLHMVGPYLFVKAE